MLYGDEHPASILCILALSCVASRFFDPPLLLYWLLPLPSCKVAGSAREHLYSTRFCTASARNRFFSSSQDTCAGVYHRQSRLLCGCFARFLRICSLGRCLRLPFTASKRAKSVTPPDPPRPSVSTLRPSKSLKPSFWHDRRPATLRKPGGTGSVIGARWFSAIRFRHFACGCQVTMSETRTICHALCNSNCPHIILPQTFPIKHSVQQLQRR